jgi:hypothetical protein
VNLYLGKLFPPIRDFFISMVIVTNGKPKNMFLTKALTNMLIILFKDLVEASRSFRIIVNRSSLKV